jgi:tetratricopeptide (TPR) repeat protein
LVRETLSTEKSIDICYDEGIYFYFALDLSDERECLEILDALISYAEETKVNKRKLAETISDAMERVRGAIYESAREKLKPYLEVLEEGSSVYYEDEAVAASSHFSIEESSAAAQTGNITALNLYFNKNSKIYCQRVISIAAQYNQDIVIEAIVGMMDTPMQKTNIYRIAGDSYVHISWEKADNYYKKSLILHPDCFITLTKLGALYEEIFYSTKDDAMRRKSMEHYELALSVPWRGDGAEYSKIVAVVKSNFDILAGNTRDTLTPEEFEALDDLLSFSLESYDSEREVVGEVAAA